MKEREGEGRGRGKRRNGAESGELRAERKARREGGRGRRWERERVRRA